MRLARVTVTGLAVWFAARVYASPAARPRLGFAAAHLIAIVGVHVLLGVEAYMAKFAAAGPQAAVPPMSRIAKEPDAAVRTAHAVVGAALLSTAVVLALRAGRRPVETPGD